MSAELKLWKYSKNYHYLGKVEGLFISTKKEIDEYLVGRTMDFGEILGKHSEVSIDFNKDDFECLDISKEALMELLTAANSRCISGYYPFKYTNEEVKCLSCGYETNYSDWEVDVSCICCPKCEYQYCKVIE